MQALRVLGNASLFAVIAAFQSGLPWAAARHLSAHPSLCAEDQLRYCLRSIRDPCYAFHKLIADGNLVGVRDLLPYFDSDRAMDAIWGQLHVLTYLHLRSKHGCTSRTMDYAAAYGHVSCLVFLQTHRREGCSQQALTYAAAGGHLECVEFLVAHPPPAGWRYIDQAEAMARRHNHLAVADNLRRLTSNGPATPTKQRWFRLLLTQKP
ncbi:hypothetical protein ACHHYP_13900 [Achlya hypogyna]|uniref:Secreted protein n=1 Tax=Achlya hypogyna TaxID=1202772 RepID=A0A0A7CPC8_ACHHY|nr:secreted protein [Achlya hypogyna]OQR84097.1 hypothetical protein ACHHYP_13900 [Achlya hypogyna]